MSSHHPSVSKLAILSAGVVLLTGLAVPFRHAAGQQGQLLRPTLVNQRIDETKLVTLRGNTRPEANANNDRGRVPDDFPMPGMLLQLKRAPELEAEFERYIDTLTDKKSPNFRHWMYAAEQGQKYGVADADIEAITSWLESHGLTVHGAYPNKMAIGFSGTAGQVRDAFHTEIHNLQVHGEFHVANMSDPQIPEALAPAVVGVVSMNDFRAHPMAVSKTDYTFAGCASTSTNTQPGTCYQLVPADFETIYNVNPLFREGILGQGETMAVVEDSDTYSNDVAVYRSTFLSGYTGTVTTIHPSGTLSCTDPGTNSADGEADLDAEVASAIAPDATIEVAACTAGFTDGVVIADENLVNSASPPPVISQSYGTCEVATGPGGTAAFYSIFQSAAAAGVSVFVSSGDYGPSPCAPDFTNGTLYAYPGIGVTGWGETPYNVSVGGTDYEDTYNAKELGIPLSTYWSSTNTSTYGSAKSYIPEIPWNDSCASVLISNYISGSFTTYGSTGFCNVSPGSSSTGYELDVAASGGPSNCAIWDGYASTNQSSYLAVNNTCSGYPKPSWQSGVFGNPADGVRDVPDVSMFAANGVWGHYMVTCWSDTSQSGAEPCTGAPSTWSGFGGTSVAAPTLAAVQLLVDQKWGIRAGNPNPTYYSIANAEFGTTGNSNCYSINLPGRRGEGSACAFNDITQGDNDIDCRGNGTTIRESCYDPSGTRGVESTGALASGYVVSAGVGYTSAPTCTVGAPSNAHAYYAPNGTQLWAGGTQATCTAAFNSGSTTEVGTITVLATPTAAWAGGTLTVGSTTYTFVNGAPTAVNQIEISTVSTTDMAKNIEATINATSSQCYTSGCFYTGQTANASATATESGATVTVTAKTAGYAGNFALSDSATINAAYLETAITTLAGGPGYVSSITVTAGGSGYAPGASCTLSGGGGSNATCSVSPSVSTYSSSYQPAFGATPGWDFATGLGSVNAYNLVMNTAW